VETSKPLKNVTSIILGRTSELILSFLAITYLIRYLGAEKYGVFSAIVASIAIFSKFIDLGFSQIIFRELSSDTGKKEIINSALSIRLLLFLMLVILYNLAAKFTHINTSEIIISNILLINILISAKLRNIRDLLEIPFKTVLRMDIVMIATFVDALTLLIFIFVAGALKFNLIEISVIYVAANLPGFSFLLFYLKKWKPFKFKFSFVNLKWLIKESMPLFGAGILSVIFLQLDVVLLREFISAKQAGFYSAAIRVGVPLSIIPLSIITTIFPIVSKNKDYNKVETKKIVESSFKILFLLLFFSAVFVSFKGAEILKLLYGAKFIPANTSLILLFWAFTFYYSSILFQNLNTILKIQKFNFYYFLVLLGIFLFVLFFTLVRMGSEGAALSRLIASAIGFLFLLKVLNKTEFALPKINFKTVAFFLIIFFLAYLLKGFGLILFLIIFSVTVIVFSFVLKFFNNDDLILFYRLLKKPKWMKKIIK